jgi:hypothetical protein
MSNVVLKLNNSNKTEWEDWCGKNNLKLFTVDTEINKFYSFDLLKSHKILFSKLIIVSDGSLLPPDNILDLCNNNICLYKCKKEKENKEFSKYFYNFKIEDNDYLDDKIILIDSSFKYLFDSIKIMYNDKDEVNRMAKKGVKWKLKELAEKGFNVDRGLLNYFIQIFNVPINIIQS